ncbi:MULTISPECIES: hypothetical protein [unclassified Streptomyces]|uniref:hypothetical protein n=2 Tax=Streptomyces TaxID=1883 RepID=UPI0001C18F16|nr:MULTISPECIES: hypothetical protein [unclassified Streptomyces]AEN12980.1 conserved hypothetical protein [Streptomyces sp. SirexAA-E]MYR69732.1 hypothetical protein [Streptomyces sp. SID4939]MYS00826.1 hypothetical protein [Streptomyces sp. SID4940]MYT65849.1 hypothetical protein [Streptomyces sp. SID8357]MYT84115.1 hypothetical protein [Streptomyces sp. SID8360]
MTTPSHPVLTPAPTPTGAGTPSPGRAATAPGGVRDRVPEALEARDALAAALTAAGIQLPAMDVRTPWQDGGPEAAEDEDGRPPRYALVHLGVCSAPVALELADVIRKGAAR